MRQIALVVCSLGACVEPEPELAGEINAVVVADGVIAGTEIEPNEDGTPSVGGDPLLGNDFGTANADVHGLVPRNITFSASLTPAGDEDVYLFKSPGRVDVFTRTALGSVICNTTTDTVLVLRDASGTVLAVNDDSHGLTKCSTVSHHVPAGQLVYIQVLAFGDQEEKDYQISFR